MINSKSLGKWMRKNDKPATEVASALKVHPVTIRRFIHGSSIRPETLAALDRYVNAKSKKSKAKKDLRYVRIS